MTSIPSLPLIGSQPKPFIRHLAEVLDGDVYPDVSLHVCDWAARAAAFYVSSNLRPVRSTSAGTKRGTSSSSAM